MAKSGLKKWFAQKWVDIGSKKKGGGFEKCGRSKQKKDAKRKYPKCVPLAKANRMTESQRRSAVKRKRSKAQGVGGKPTNVKTFAMNGMDTRRAGAAVKGFGFRGVF
jgi:E3 ubiquitin-protein ligase DOA10|tara:strand:+ start:57 stop:377 length:321 start_codon:yes stop_codon:yes gene_type:complete